MMPTYRRMPTLFVRGSGKRLYDEQGNAYLDFLAEIAVCALGALPPPYRCGASSSRRKR